MPMNGPSASCSEGRARWALRLVGGFELNTLAGGEKVTALGKRERVLLAYLALNPKGKEQRRKLTTLLWGDSADETTLENLRNCLYGLRKALGDSEHRVIASDGEDIALDAAAFEVDVLAFRRLAGSSEPSDLDRAAKLYTGGLLDGLDIDSEEFESWRRTEAARYREQAVDVLDRLMSQLADAGETDRAIETGNRILTLEPLHEGAVRRLMRLHANNGRRSAAIQLYRTLSDALKADLGAQPEAETRALFAEITRGGDEPPIAPAATEMKPQAPMTSSTRPSDAVSEPLLPPARRLAPAIGALWQAQSSKRNWILAGGFAAAVMAAFLLYQFATPSTEPQAGVDAAKTVSSSSANAISIAVLPFVNLSGDPEQEFFSDGITEEITAALAKIKDLRVVGRTSAYQFKDERKDLRAIGQALSATHLIEGSVRKEANRLRITAQLIESDNGVHLWTESYDRELTGVFAIQEEIANAIAGALRVPLGLAPGETMVSNRNIDPESYEQYLRAKALRRTSIRSNITESFNILEQVVARNPDYAPALAALSGFYIRMDNNRAEAMARRAIELDPNLPDGYLALGGVEGGRQKTVLAEELISKALALDPTNEVGLWTYGNFLGRVGRVKEALATYQRLRVLEPFDPKYNGNLSDALWLNGQDDAAIAVLKALPGNLPVGMSPGGLREMAMIHAAAGRYKEAADAMQQLSTMNVSPELAAISKEAARLLRTAPAKYPSPQDLPRLGQGFVGRAGFVYLYIGAEGRALEEYEEQREAGFFSPSLIALLWHPSYAPVRKTERFKTYVRKAGLVEYWRAKGWPEFCRPVGADDFACE
jgi:TolB-like protein/DNA-binding SARP family transcriptional activator/Tfp pilus assembly protein PilF